MARLMFREGRFLLVLVAFALLTAAWAQPYGEAPQLAQQVEAGQLPPVEERLPLQPMVVEVVERIGEYGGDWSMATVGVADAPSQVYSTILYDHLVRWNMEWTDVLPNIAESWDISDDASEYTFHLREGIKWSDGTPFTSADIMFWAEDVVGNSELSPGGLPGWMRVGGESGVITAPDDYTVVFTFPAPHALFLQLLATPGGHAPTMIQAEYAKQFHIDYNEEAAELASEQGFASWIELFQNRLTDYGNVNNPDQPTLTAWRLVNPLGQRLVYERNPFYWKVDSEGNQLPYIDRVIYPLVEDGEVLLLRMMGGEVDFMVRHTGNPAHKPVLLDSMERGNYRLIDLTAGQMNEVVIALNLVDRDPARREVFQNKLFRQALSVAINRDDIIDLVFVAQGEPWQASPRPESPFYNETLAKQFTQYDPEQARAWLDEAGYTVGPDGWRLGPDGQPIIFEVEVIDGFRTWADTVELVTGFWQEVGVRANWRIVERSLFYTRKGNNEVSASVWNGPGGLGDVMVEPRWYLPVTTEANYAIPWALWYLNPENPIAEEPSPAVRQQMELYDQLRATPGTEARAELMNQILQIAQEEFMVMGITLPAPSYGIQRNDFHNVPEGIFNAWHWPRPGPAHPEQFFTTRR